MLGRVGGRQPGTNGEIMTNQAHGYPTGAVLSPLARCMLIKHKHMSEPQHVIEFFSVWTVRKQRYFLSHFACCEMRHATLLQGCGRSGARPLLKNNT